MRDFQENKLSMYRATEQFLDNNNAVWSGIPAIVTTKTAFSAKIAAIIAASQQQEVIITGISTDKGVLKNNLVNLVYPIASALTAFASQNNNNEMLEQVSYSRNDLLRTKDDIMGQRCQNIHDIANTNLAALANFGITAPVLATLQTSINDYTSKVPAPRTARVGKAAVTTALKNLFKETDVILKLQLDKLIVQLKATQPDFFNAYTGAREIIDLGSTTAKVRGVVTRKDNNVVLSNVKFTIYGAGTDTVIKQVITDAEGKFSATQIPFGDYDFKWELQGYMVVNETNIHISAGKELKRKITMKKGGASITLTGDVAAGAIANISVNGIEAVDETSIRLKVTGSTLRFYAATGNMEPADPPYIDVLPGQIIQKYVFEFAAQIGFDEQLEDFLNVQNVGATQGHWEMKFENLGA